jgi:hypothetical protein
VSRVTHRSVVTLADRRVQLWSRRTPRLTTGVSRVHEGIHFLKRTIGLGGALALGVSTVLLAAPASAAATGTIHPSDFVDPLSDTRATGHYAVAGTGLHIWTDGNTNKDEHGINTDKVAEYVATKTPLAHVGEPALGYSNTSGGGVPGFQLVIDFDRDGTADGILVGEPTVTSYGDNWWLNNAAAPVAKAGAPHTGGGQGSNWFGSLDEWRSNFSKARVLAFGFSLGSGVQGDGVIDAIDFAGTRYTFAKDVTLHSKDQCKNDGWATSTDPTYENQGECVSSLSKKK